MVYPYAKYSVFNRKSPLELQLPWIEWETIKVIENEINSQSCVYEFGSGGSTLFFGKRVKYLLSVENDYSWFLKTKGKVEQENMSGKIDLRFAPFQTDIESYKNSDYLNFVRIQNWDLILVDGFTDFHGFRPEAFRLSWLYLKPGGILIFDDIWMFPECKNEIIRMGGKICKGVGPRRYGVTETAWVRKPL